MQTKSIENKLRKELSLQGYKLQKRVITNDPMHSGCYRIVNVNNNLVEAGEHFDLTLDDVVMFIQEK